MKDNPRRPAVVLLAGAFALLTGCSGANSRVPAPSLSPESAAQQAMAEYDTNGDGFLDEQELARCPALKSCLKELDRDKDGRLTAREIADRLTLYRDSRIGLMSATCHVTLDGRPLIGGSVTLTPERFLGPDIKPATGVTDGNGRALLQATGQSLPGVHCGLYRVTVSKKNAAGRELLPARYNDATVLGQEVAPGMRGSIQLRLTSK
jgi:hypothetical protein